MRPALLGLNVGFIKHFQNHTPSKVDTATAPRFSYSHQYAPLLDPSFLSITHHCQMPMDRYIYLCAKFGNK